MGESGGLAEDWKTWGLNLCVGVHITPLDITLREWEEYFTEHGDLFIHWNFEGVKKATVTVKMSTLKQMWGVRLERRNER